MTAPPTDAGQRPVRRRVLLGAAAAVGLGALVVAGGDVIDRAGRGGTDVDDAAIAMPDDALDDLERATPPPVPRVTEPTCVGTDELDCFRWTAAAAGVDFGAVVATEDLVVVADPQADHLRALDAADGTTRWTVEDDDVVLAAGEDLSTEVSDPDLGTRHDAVVLALDAATGATRWERRGVAASITTTGQTVHEDEDGVVEVLETSGERRWTTRSSPGQVDGAVAYPVARAVGHAVSVTDGDDDRLRRLDDGADLGVADAYPLAGDATQPVDAADWERGTVVVDQRSGTEVAQLPAHPWPVTAHDNGVWRVDLGGMMVLRSPGHLAALRTTRPGDGGNAEDG